MTVYLVKRKIFSRWSGLDADDLKGVTTSLREVQAVLLDKFSSDTILVGHSLESDLKALRVSVNESVRSVRLQLCVCMHL